MIYDLMFEGRGALVNSGSNPALPESVEALPLSSRDQRFGKFYEKNPIATFKWKGGVRVSCSKASPNLNELMSKGPQCNTVDTHSGKVDTQRLYLPCIFCSCFIFRSVTMSKMGAASVIIIMKISEKIGSFKVTQPLERV